MAEDVPPELRRALIKFIMEALKQAETGEGNHFHKLKYELDCTTKKRNPKNIARWYTVLQDCVHWLTPEDAHKPLMEVIFRRFDWDLSTETISAYVKFLIALYTHDIRFVKQILTILVWNMCPRLDRQELYQAAGKYQNFQNPNFIQTEICPENASRTDSIHEVLVKMRDDYAPTSSLLMPVLVKMFPHKFRESHVFLAYSKALHRILINFPELRDRIFGLIMSQVAYMDFELFRLENRAQRSRAVKVSVLQNVFQQSKARREGKLLRLDPETRRRLKTITQSTDVIIAEIFYYIRGVHKKKPEQIHSIFLEVLRVFQDGLLTTRTKTVQYILFYIASFDSIMAEEFLMRLLKLAFDQSESMLKRRCATNYVAALICKANFLRFASCMASFDHMVKWCIRYLDLYHERFGTNAIGPSVAEFHVLFYTMCQAIFLIFCYRRDAFEATPGTSGSFTKSAESCGLDRIISSALQPLIYCHYNIAKEFVMFCWTRDIMCDLPAIRNWEMQSWEKKKYEQERARKEKSTSGGNDTNTSQDGEKEACRFWAAGKCGKGEKCPYAHLASQKGRPGVCYAFKEGRCTRGDSCKFSHDSGSGREKQARTCEYWRKGTCFQGASCQYLHRETGEKDNMETANSGVDEKDVEMGEKKEEKKKDDDRKVDWHDEDKKRIVTFPFDEFYLPICSRVIYPLFRRYECKFSCPSPPTRAAPTDSSPCMQGAGNAMDTATPILDNMRSPNLDNLRSLDEIPDLTL